MTATAPLRPALPMRIANRLRQRDAPEGFSATLAWAALIIGVLAPVCVAVPIGWPAKFLVLLVFVCIGPGSAIVAFVQLGDALAAATVALMLSLGLSAAFAVTMVWTKAWHPLPALIILAALTAIGGAIRLLPRFASQSLPPPSALAPPSTVTPPTAHLQPGDASRENIGGPADASANTAVTQMANADQPGKTGGAIPTAASPSGGVTAVLPAANTADSAQTSIIPKVREAAGDETSVIPAIRDTALDQTSVIPAIRDAALDETTVIPAIRDTAPDETSVIPAIRDTALDQTSVIPAIRDTASDETSIIRLKPDAPARVAASPSGSGTAEQPRIESPANPSRSYLVVHACLIVSAIAMWVYGLSQSNTANVGDYGLLSVMKPGFFTALATCVLGFVVALSAKRLMPLVLVAYIVVLVLVMHATAPALLANPEYAWTLRHVGVIEFIRSLGGVNNPLDIYQEWPTFFALVGQLVSLSGAHTMTVASWAPVFFDLAYCLPLFAIARTLSNDPRVPYLSVFTFTALNWVAQDYLSPQAFAFLLCLGILLVMLRWLRRMPGPLVQIRPRLLGKLWSWLQDGLVEVPYTSKAARRLALTVLYFVFAVVVASHQLSPYLIAASAVSLVIFGLIRPIRIVPILVGIALGYVIPRYQVVDNYGIFDGLNFLHNASGVGPKATATTITPGREFSVKVVETLALSVWGLTATTLFSSRRKLGPVALPGTLAFAPFVMLLAQSYGGEAIYRVFLFSSPWCAYLIAHQTLALVRWARTKRLARFVPAVVGVPVLIVMVLASIQGAHGQLAFDQFTSGEVHGAQYLYANVPEGSDIVYASSNFPGKLTARYGDIASGKVVELTLLETGPSSDIAETGVPDIDGIDVYFRSLKSPVKYFVFSKSMIEYAHYFGYLPDGTLQSMSSEVSTSQSFQLWYHADGIVIFKYIG